MPSAESDLDSPAPPPHEPLSRLPFPPITRSHILHCSYHYWHPRYRTLTPKARLIPLSPPFIDYLRADGIVLPAEDHELHSSTDNDSGIFSASTSPTASDSDSDSVEPDPSLEWLSIHQKIQETIQELKGCVHPKLNWSAPKDATWIAATNSMECRTANDVYLLLKSSDFITHDLEQAYDGCEADADVTTTTEQIPFHLVLRQTIPALVTSLEFRCFVRGRELLGICQRDLNHYAFLPGLVPRLRGCIEGFFEDNLRESFPDDSFVFDVYVPPPHDRTWLIDINPWAPRTDPLLFSWLEVLQMRGSISEDGMMLDGSPENDEEGVGDQGDKSEEVGFTPEFRLVNRDDPEAYSFNTPQYSAHKLPKDVVDASGDGEAGLRDFMGQWRDILRKQEADDVHEKNDDT
ncbi:MAG: hypothetical protein Q9195_001637 [Heterodermia aff. obscurata]